MPGGTTVAEAPASGVLRLRLLGGFDLALDGEPVALDAPRLRSLLAELALNRGSRQPREQIAALFWPDSGEGQARTNLRRAIHSLRQALPDSETWLDSETRALGLRAGSAFTLDVAEFEEHLAAAQQARQAGGDGERDALEAALGLYAGDLFPACYEEWIVSERDRLRAAWLAASERLAELLEQGREYRVAMALVRRVVDDDPLNEDATRRLMRLQALAGHRAAALRTYHGFATLLARETGVDPGAEIREIHERLLSAQGSAEPAAGAAVTRAALVGRTAEWRALQEAWTQASAGRARLVAITGEAGIGKSRLAEELRDWVARQGGLVAGSRCYEAIDAVAYAPAMEILRAPVVSARLRGLGRPWRSELSRLLPELRDIDPDLPEPPPVADALGRARLLDALTRAVLAPGQPLLLVADDLQWADRETLGWLEYLVRSQPEAPVLIVATARSENVGPDHPLQRILAGEGGGDLGMVVELGPLGADETIALAHDVSGGAVGEDAEAAVYAETEGNPLFVVEWMRAGSGAGGEDSAEPGGAPLPPRVQSVIQARLAQLTPVAQEIAALAATAGQTFGFKLLAHASPRTEEEIVDAIDELWQRRILREAGADAYDFTHDKLREVSYAGVGTARRQMLHKRIAQALERLHGTNLEPVAGELARHYDRAGLPRRAIDFYRRAGESAARLHANEDALARLDRGLELLRKEPPSNDRDERELALLRAAGAPLVIVHGYGAPEVDAAYARAAELAETRGEPADPPILRARGLLDLVHGRLEQSEEIGAQLVEGGRAAGDPMVEAEGDYLIGVSAFWLGRFVDSRRHLEKAIALYDPDRAAEHLAAYSQDIRVVCLSRLAYTLGFLGEATEARRASEEALRHGRMLGHPYSLSYALGWSSALAIDLGDVDTARTLVAERTALEGDHGFGFERETTRVLGGWSTAAGGDPDAGIDAMRAAIETEWRAGPLRRPMCFILLAGICLDAGRHDDARVAIHEGMELAVRINQRWSDAEFQILLGRLAAAEGDAAEARSRYEEAIKIAERQGAQGLAERANAELAAV